MSDQIAQQREQVEQHIRLENQHDWDAVHKTFAAGAPTWFDMVPFGARLDGPAGIATAYHLLSTALPDVAIEVLTQYDIPGCSIRELMITGTHTGDWCGIPGSGRRVQFQLACFFEFGTGAAQGQLIAERVYFNNETLIKQMRGE